jgi:hypothetical protein
MKGSVFSGEFLDHQHASPAFEALGNHPLCELRQRFQETEIGCLPLPLTVAVRNAMDQNPARAEYWL